MLLRPILVTTALKSSAALGFNFFTPLSNRILVRHNRSITTFSNNINNVMADTSEQHLEENQKKEETEKNIPTDILSKAANDILFRYIEEQQRTSVFGPTFGHLLDAGTGTHSLRWIASLLHRPALLQESENQDRLITNYTAITADERMRQNVLRDARALHVEEYGNVLIGNWATAASADVIDGDNTNNDYVADCEQCQQQQRSQEQELCDGEVYDTILADYLIGCVLLVYCRGVILYRLEIMFDFNICCFLCFITIQSDGRVQSLLPRLHIRSFSKALTSKTWKTVHCWVKSNTRSCGNRWKNYL